MYIFTTVRHSDAIWIPLSHSPPIVLLLLLLLLHFLLLLDRSIRGGEGRISQSLPPYYHSQSKMRSISLIIALVAATAMAAPSPTVSERTLNRWSAPLARFYQEIDKTIDEAMKSPDFPNPPSCDMSKASLPLAPTPLASPDADTYLRHVAIGRGVQVCSLISSSFVPRMDH